MVSGSTRSGSTNTAVLRTAREVTPEGVTVVRYDGLSELPAFNPDDDREPLPPAVADLRHRIGAAQAALFCTPEYAGGLPGSLKNLLDWTVGGVELSDKPVAWINCASVAAPTGGSGAHGALATVLGYVGADVVDGACLRLPITRDAVGPDGVIIDATIREHLTGALGALVRHVDGASAGPSLGERRVRYRRDATVLAELGVVLAAGGLPTVEVRVPAALADTAVAAWDRDETDHGDLPYAESPEQRRDRHRAGALALVGLAITERGRRDGDAVLVDLAPELVGVAVDTADDLPTPP